MKKKIVALKDNKIFRLVNDFVDEDRNKLLLVRGGG
jgi:hypothetical protein